MGYILKGSQILALQFKSGSNPRHQSKNIEMKYKTHIKVPPPPRTYRGCQIRAGQPSCKHFAPAQDFFKYDRKLLPTPPNFEKKHCSCIFEGHLTTNPILSALHLQGFKSNIYVHFHPVNKSLIGISIWK